jgi:hypothetical protein
MPNETELALALRGERLALRVPAYRFWRRMVGKYKRLLRWEFWPPYVFYPPVVAYIIYLGLRFRNWTLFTAANPAIPAGGFVGESKHEILRELRGVPSAIPAHTLLDHVDANERVQRAEQFLQENQLSFPVVLKPDAGQRGTGVAIIRSSRQLREYLEKAAFPVILQEYGAGKEFGVFYYRYPGERHGHILSITEKRMPVLVGDGRRTVEDLILGDDRAICMADFYLRQNSKRLQYVPASGEQVELVEIGAHCRGAIFLDGSYAITPALEKAMQEIADGFDGFHFGRFDIRVPSITDLMVGHNLKVIELNGVTSEATHIYDPTLSLFDAYRTLFRQWRIAFEIGKQNHNRGAQSSSLIDLLKRVRDYGQLARRYAQ